MLIRTYDSLGVGRPPRFYSARLYRAFRAFTLKVSHAPISVECLFPMTLLPGAVPRRD